MSYNFLRSIGLSALLLGCSRLGAQVNVKAANPALIFSTVKGTVSRPDTLRITPHESSLLHINILGEQAQQFKLISANTARAVGGQRLRLIVEFSPSDDLIGIASAKLQVKDASGKVIHAMDLRGLSLKGLEGHNEPALATVFSALGYSINTGWTGVANNVLPDLQGDEVHAWAFQKAGKGTVRLRPVARFSPDYALPFGYYISSPAGPQTRQVGILNKATTISEHQTLFPGMSAGASSFDPGDSVFGLYTTSPTHPAYTADDWNWLLSPGKAGHAARVYPAKDQAGKLLENTYLVCYEEAQNGDYQDYVFLIDNVRPLRTKEEYADLLNGKDLEGWTIYLQKNGLDNDPDHNFSVEDGAVHVRGRDLGYIRTKESFTNYHFKVEFKWGQTKWPPRENAKRDGGVCYNIPDNEPDSIWPKSIECQIQEGDVGDFWLLSFSTIEVDGQVNKPSNHTRVLKKKDAEKPNGEWNTVEVISYNGRCIQIVNGIVVNDGDKASIPNGRILLQSEYSEIYYRNAQIRKL